VDASRIGDFIAWPSHDNNDRIELVTAMSRLLQPTSCTYVKKSDVKLDAALTEWDMIKSTFKRQVEAGQHEYEPHNITYIF